MDWMKTNFQLGVKVLDMTTMSQGNMGVHAIPISVCQKCYDVSEPEAEFAE